MDIGPNFSADLERGKQHTSKSFSTGETPTPLPCHGLCAVHRDPFNQEQIRTARSEIRQRPCCWIAHGSIRISISMVHRPRHLRHSDSPGEYADDRPFRRARTRDGNLRPASCNTDASVGDSSRESLPGFLVGTAEGSLIILWPYSGSMFRLLAACWVSTSVCSASYSRPVGIGLMISSLAVTQQQGLFGVFPLYGASHRSVRICHPDCQHAAGRAIHHVARSIAIFFDHSARQLSGRWQSLTLLAAVLAACSYWNRQHDHGQQALPQPALLSSDFHARCAHSHSVVRGPASIL